MSNRFLSFGRRRTTLVLFLLELFFYFSVTCSFLIEQRIHHYYRPNSAIQQKMSLTTTLSSTSHRIGFIGCGTIASAIVTGFATIEDKKEKDSNINDDDEGGGQPPPPLVKSIAISRRSRSKSEALKEKFPTLVTVYDENQEILDHADIIFITVLPQQASDVLQSLQFDSERHHLVSLVSTSKLDDLVRDSGLDSSHVSKMICLPSIAQHEGICLHCCPIPNPTLTTLFRKASGVVTLSDEREMEAAMVTTCLMGPIYGIMREGRDWLLQHTKLSPTDASYLIIQQYIGFIQDANHESNTNPHRLDDLIAEQTAGGLNEQGLFNLDLLGGLDAHRRVMDATYSRIRGDTDGNILGG